MPISQYYDAISQCNKCGFCQVACPVFRSTGHESGVARGRLALLRAIIEKRLEWTPDLESPLYDCLLCGACTANCFPAVPTSNLVIKARAEYLEKVGRKPVHRLLFDHLLPYPRRLYLAARAVALGKNTGMADLAKALGLLRFLGPNFTAAQDIVAHFPLRPLRDAIKPGHYAGEGTRLRIGYFVGCGVDIIAQDAGRATFAYLRKTAKSVQVLDNCCCALPAYTYGDLDVAAKLAEKNLRRIPAHALDMIVTDCSSCASFLKKYPELFPDGSNRHHQAQQTASRVKDMVEVISPATPTDESAAPVTATYHDPCHASRGQGIVREPRELLKRTPGINYVELPEADWCCGGAGAYALSHYDLSKAVLDRKMENLKKTGASLLVTSCPACIIQLSYGVRQHGLKVRVCHISEAIQLEKP